MRAKSFSKVIAIAVALLLFSVSLQAQFSQGRLQATGLTCALCSKSIHQALDQLPFTELVKPELKSSSFDIRFKSGQPVSVQSIRTAVEDAGFFVGQLTLELSVAAADSLRSGNRLPGETSVYQVLGEWKEGQTLQVIEKGFLSEKDLKRILSRYPESQKELGKVIYLLPVKK